MGFLLCGVFEKNYLSIWSVLQDVHTVILTRGSNSDLNISNTLSLKQNARRNKTVRDMGYSNGTNVSVEKPKLNSLVAKTFNCCVYVFVDNGTIKTQKIYFTNFHIWENAVSVSGKQTIISWPNVFTVSSLYFPNYRLYISKKMFPELLTVSPTKQLSHNPVTKCAKVWNRELNGANGSGHSL